MRLIDSHCHLDGDQFEHDRDAVIARALDAGVVTMLAIGTGDGPPDLEAALRLADRYPCFLATAGIHPHDAAKATNGTIQKLGELLRHPKCVAMGEIGLDYHYDFAPRDTQRGVFVDQMSLARECRKPIVIHTREAWGDMFALLEQHWAPTRLACVLHCFTGSPEEMRRGAALGSYFGIGGVVTFPRATELQDAVREMPLDRILLETDAPYLAPVPYRGKRNEPAFVLDTARKVAELRGISLEALAEATTNNFERLCLR
jgi:TatD DNase family protein